MIRRFAFAIFSLGLVWACGDDEKPPPPGYGGSGDASDGGTGGSATSGGSAGKGGSSGKGGSAGKGGSNQGGTSASGNGGKSETGGAGGEDPGGAAGTGGSAGYPPCPSDSAMGPAPAFDAVCEPERMLGPAMDVPLMDAAANLVGVTPDELTIAYYASTLMGETFYVADRAMASDAFDAGRELPGGPVYVTLSPDGLRLVELSNDGSAFSEHTRTLRGEAFSATAVEGTFATLNADASARDLSFAGCVISADDRTLFYLASDGQSDQPLHVSTRSGTGPWPVGQVIEACEFQTQGGMLRQPTALSSDTLTLFYYDLVRGQARAAWRPSTSEPFEWFEDLGVREDAQANAACDRLYYTWTSGPAFSSID